MAGKTALAPWDRRPDESAKAFEAFVVYRDMGAERSLERVSQEHSKAVPTLKKWSARYEWVSRSAEYDTEVARRTAIRIMESDVEALARQVQQARAIQAQAARKLLSPKFSPDELSGEGAARTWALAAKEERAARRIPTSVEHTGKDGGPIRHVVDFGYSDEAPNEADDDVSSQDDPE